MENASFPRAALAEILSETNRVLGFPPPACENARRLGDPHSLVIACGQQPCAFGGPLFVVYKALTTIRLAREAETWLGVPVIPVFWIASDDHDLDEVSRAVLPGPGGARHRYRADLKAWRGRPIASVGSDDRWEAPARDWLETHFGSHAEARALRSFLPDPAASWVRWFARILGRALGSLGLVALEPQELRPLSATLFARAIRDWERIEEEIEASLPERVQPGSPGNFSPLEGPPLFLEGTEEEGNLRLRILTRDGALGLRGRTERLSVQELSALAEREPGRFSAHAALRPVLQNALLPVVAQVLGPGELAYQEELYRFHASELGAGRRMPVPWPRFSATLIDERADEILLRFALRPSRAFLPEDELVGKALPPGALAESLRFLAWETLAKLEPLREEGLRLDGNLKRPFEKTASTIESAFAKLSAKVQHASARAEGFAPEDLRRLSAWFRPDQKPQERVFSFPTLHPVGGAGAVAALLEAVDILDRRHQVVRFPRTE
jgi:bacillithiol biosynthesis cysteine-adding enzyme BshC